MIDSRSKGARPPRSQRFGVLRSASTSDLFECRDGETIPALKKRGRERIVLGRQTLRRSGQAPFASALRESGPLTLKTLKSTKNQKIRANQ